MSGKGAGLLLVVGLAAIAAIMSVFTVDEREYALKFRFGEVIDSDFEPGLHFKLPVVNNVRKFPRRILTLDNEPEEIITAEKKTVFVDFFVKWRIVNPEQYYTSTGGAEDVALGRLLEIVKGSIRNEFAKRTVREVVSVQRSELMVDMQAAAADTARELGVELIDLRVNRIEFPDRVAEAVFRRMRQERDRVAKELRAEGAEEAEQLEANADRQRTVIIAEAYKQAEKLRGEGDARAAQIYANAYEKDPEFYSFHRSIEAYRNAIGREGDILVLDPNSEFFRYLRNSGGEPGGGR